MSIDPTGSGSPLEQDNIQVAQKNVKKFQENLQHYSGEQDLEMKNNLQGVMQDSLDLVNASLKGIKTSGIQEQGKIVQKDFNNYQQSNSDQDLTKLNNDIATLQQYLTESLK